MKHILLVLFLLACQTEPSSEQQTAPTQADVAPTDAKPASTPDANEAEEKSDEETPVAEPTDDKEKAQKAPAAGDAQEAKKTDAANPDVGLFVGYDHAGKKGSLSMNCSMCRRLWTKKEDQFAKACTAQGGKIKACGCLTILCSVKVN